MGARTVQHLTPFALLGAALFAVMLTCMPLSDPDYFWHLKAGEWIVTNGMLAPGDVFSHTRAGQPWVQHEWLFEVVLYYAHHYGGGFGVRLLTISLFFAALMLSASLAYRITRSAPAAALMSATAVFPLLIGLSPRPQLVTYVGFALMLTVLLEFKYRRRLRMLAVLPPLMLVWVNCHGGYAAGIALLALFTLCEWMVSRWGNGPLKATRRELAYLAAAGVAALLATLANPWFIDHWRYPFEVMGMAYNKEILEWKSPDFAQLMPQFYLAVAIMFTIGCARAWERFDLTECVVPALFLMLGFTGVRHLPLGAVVALPFGALALARSGLLEDTAARMRALNDYLVAQIAPRVGERFGAWLRRPAPAPKPAPSWQYWLMFLAGLGMLTLLEPMVRESQRVEFAHSYPVHAAEFVDTHGLTGRMFNEYGAGGYLIHRFTPRLKVLVDGRADVYGDPFLLDYLTMYAARQGWKPIFEALRIDFAILPCNAPLGQILQAEKSFREVYRDSGYVVMVRLNEPRYDALPSVSSDAAPACRFSARAPE